MGVQRFLLTTEPPCLFSFLCLYLEATVGKLSSRVTCLKREAIHSESEGGAAPVAAFLPLCVEMQNVITKRSRTEISQLKYVTHDFLSRL